MTKKGGDIFGMVVGGLASILRTTETASALAFSHVAPVLYFSFLEKNYFNQQEHFNFKNGNINMVRTFFELVLDFIFTNVLSPGFDCP